MKKILLSLSICFLTVAGAAAQNKGEMAIGLNLGAAPCLEKGASMTNFGVGAKFQYNVTNPIRIEADVDYWLKSKGVDMVDVSANIHYLFNLGEKLKFYPIVGVGYAHIGGCISSDYGDVDPDGPTSYDYVEKDDYSDESSSPSANKFLLNVGVGAEYALNDRLNMGAEIKYQYIKDFNRLPITVGVTYCF